MKKKYLIYIPFLIFSFFQTINAQETNQEVAQESAEELAKKLANPISSLISLPFQNNVDFGIGANFALGPRFNLASPSGAKADMGVRAVIVFLFPK
jgi:hypothetical protein